MLLSRPLHLADNATERESPPLIAARELLERPQHPILIETSVAQIGVGVILQFELAVELRRGGINPDLRQSLQMVLAPTRAYDVDRFVAGNRIRPL